MICMSQSVYPTLDSVISLSSGCRRSKGVMSSNSHLLETKVAQKPEI
jgi:hypothetical protein